MTDDNSAHLDTRGRQTAPDTTCDTVSGVDLAESEERFRLAMEHSAIGMCLVSPEGTFQRVNAALCRILGRDADDLVSCTWQELTHPEDLDADLSLVDEVLTGRRDAYRLLKRFLRSDGSLVWGDLSVACVRGDDQAVRYFVSQIVDVTEREQALAELTQSRELFHALMENSAVGMALTSAEGRLVRVNDALCTFFGRSREVLEDCSWSDLTLAGDVEGEMRLLGEVDAGSRQSYRLRKTFVRPDGSQVNGDLTVSCVRSSDDGVRYYIGQILDVTERETAIVQLEGTLKAMLDPYVMFATVVSPEGRVVDLEFLTVNEAATQYLRRSREDLLGSSLHAQFPDIAATILDMADRVRQTGSAILDDVPVVIGTRTSADGRSAEGPRWYDVRGARVDADRVSFTWRDVSERHRTSQALAEREAEFRLLADNSTDVILRSRSDGGIEWVSPSVTEMLGWTPDQVVGRRVPELMHPEDLARVIGVQREILHRGGTEGRTTVRFATADGGWRWMSDHGRAILNDDGNVIGGIDSLRDVQEEHNAVEALASSELHFRTQAERAARAERELRGVIDSLFDPWVLLTAVRDESGQIVDFVYADANDAACEFNRRTRDELIDERLLTLLPDHGPRGLVDRYAQVVETGEPLLLDDEPFTNLDDGVEHRFDNRAVKVGDGISFTWRDVTASFNSRKALQERSERDGLTGVANRRRLEERLRELSEQAPRTGTNLAVLFCDLDHFKDINDEFGHVAGDAVLTAVAQRISSAVREGDLVARVGGDEFVVVLPGMHSLDDALAVASKVATAVQRPLTLGDATVQALASVGVALSATGDDPADVLSKADAALYEAKRSGRNRIVSATSE